MRYSKYVRILAYIWGSNENIQAKKKFIPVGDNNIACFEHNTINYFFLWETFHDGQNRKRSKKNEK